MAAPPGVGALVGERYQLVAPAPDRGAGETWRALDTRRTDVTVSLKWLRPIEGDVMPPALLGVIHALKALRHEAVPTTLHHGIHARRPWVVFDDVHGESLGALLDAARARGAHLDLDLLRKAFDAVSAAIAAAHAAPLPVLHAALTPGSVIVPPKPLRGMHGLVLDLGLAPWLDPPRDAPPRSARLLVARAPELAAGAPTVAADVFALGALLTEMLALPAPAGETMAAVTVARRRPDVPDAVWSVLATAMASSPAQRPRDVSALCAELDSAWRATAPSAGSRLSALVAGASSGAGSLLETVAPSGPSLTPKHVSAPRPLITPSGALPVSGPLPPVGATPAGARSPLAQLIEQTALYETPEAESTAVLPADPPEQGAENPWSTAVLQRVHARAEPPSLDDAETLVSAGSSGAITPAVLPLQAVVGAPPSRLGALADAIPMPPMNEPSGTLVASRPVPLPTPPTPREAPSPAESAEAPVARSVVALVLVLVALVLVALAAAVFLLKSG